MAIIKRKRGNVIYVYEVTYVGSKDGKEKRKEKVLGHLDEAGNLVPSKKMRGKNLEDFPAQIKKVTTITTEFRVVEKKEKAPQEFKKTEEEKASENHYPLMKQEIAVENPLTKKMFSGKAINALALARPIGKLSRFSNKLEVNGVNIFLPSSVHEIGVGAAKIVRYAIAEFTKLNTSNATGEKLNLRLFLDVKDFALANGVDTQSITAMRNFRVKLKKSLEILRSAGLSWEQQIKGQQKSYSGMNYIGGYDLKRNTLMIDFTLQMAEYLTSLPLMKYPRSLYKLDDRDFNAFAIGEAMCIHYSKDNNVIARREGKLRVETLLKNTSFPTYEELKKHKWSWERYVKESFETALDRLVQCGFLKDWEYCYAGGIKMTDEEIRAGKIDSYKKFISLVVNFELNDYAEHDSRLIEITQKKDEKIKKTSRKKQN